MCTWDPFNTLIISDIDGKVTYENIIEGVNMREEGDEQTGLSELVIVESRDKTKVPQFRVEGDDEVTKIFNMPMGAILVAKRVLPLRVVMFWRKFLVRLLELVISRAVFLV